MIRGSCHCGAVSFRLEERPEWLTECNCSICRRLGALWAHAEPAVIEIQSGPDATRAYIWGDRDIAIHTCRTCGCTTHWENLRPEEFTRMAVNCRMAAPEDISEIRVRHFDDAETWKFVD